MTKVFDSDFKIVSDRRIEALHRHGIITPYSPQWHLLSYCIEPSRDGNWALPSCVNLVKLGTAILCQRAHREFQGTKSRSQSLHLQYIHRWLHFDGDDTLIWIGVHFFHKLLWTYLTEDTIVIMLLLWIFYAYLKCVLFLNTLLNTQNPNNPEV